MTHLLARADAVRLPLPDRSVALCFGSPPYRKARLYLEDGKDLGVARDTEPWIDWMLAVTAECLRVTAGAVVWVAAGSTEDRNYHPICEGLMYRWWQRGGHAYRPCYWHRSGIPGSGKDQWFRADVEYAMCFKRPGPLPWADNTAMGHHPKYGPGGELSHRTSSGRRVNQWGGDPSSCGRRVDGRKMTRERAFSISARNPEALANPGNLISTGAGGGNQLGHPLAHQNEAPFPEDLAEWFIRPLAPPGSIVLDPFSGSGTTVAVAERLGRSGIGLDLRRSQCELGRRRIERPHAPVKKSRRPEADRLPLFD